MNLSAPLQYLALDRHSASSGVEPLACAAEDEAHLSAASIVVTFGGQQVLRNASFDLHAGQIALLRGPNGSGKTTLLNVLSGFLQPDSGSVSLEVAGKRRDLLGMSPDCIARAGISRLWQDIRLFPTMTVLENVLAASPHALGLNPIAALLAISRVRRQQARFRMQAMEWLELLGMAEYWNSSGDKLSVGQAKRVAIARMLQTGAHILLLDEPLAGLDRDAAFKLVGDLNRLADTTHKAILVVEHNHDAITPVCDVRLTLRDGILEREILEGAAWGS